MRKHRPAPCIDHDSARSSAALELKPLDTLNLDEAGLGDWDIRLSGNTWILSGSAGGSLAIGGASGARMRIVRQGVAYLLIGANGHKAILPTVQAARSGETLLIAPGTYHEGLAFRIDRSVTLQGVSELGIPIVGSDSGAATIVVSSSAADSVPFDFDAAGVVIQGLNFLADRQHREVPGFDMSALPQVRMFSGSGILKRIYLDIQSALDAAEEGDRIMVPAGRHVGDLHVRTGVTLAGMNMGRPSGAASRGVETTILGRVIMTCSARSLVLDGLVIWGDFEMERATAPARRFALRNCVVDGRDSDAAVSLARGASSEIINNLILGGVHVAISIRGGFDDLSISGNRIEASTGAVGISVHGGADTDRMEILGNTFVEGDYGIFIHADGNLGTQGDSVLLSGNHFGEDSCGMACSAPAVAGVHADGPLPAWLELSLGMSLDLNTCHPGPCGVGMDIVFQPPESQSVVRSLTSFAGRRRRRARNEP